MNRTLIYGLLLIGGLAMIARKAKKYYDRLQVRFSGFTIDELILTGNTTATFTLDIYNPTPVALTINSLIGIYTLIIILLVHYKIIQLRQ